jgi:hypothetical protein
LESGKVKWGKMDVKKMAATFVRARNDFCGKRPETKKTDTTAILNKCARLRPHVRHSNVSRLFGLIRKLFKFEFRRCAII